MCPKGIVTYPFFFTWGDDSHLLVAKGIRRRVFSMITLGSQGSTTYYVPYLLVPVHYSDQRGAD